MSARDIKMESIVVGIIIAIMFMAIFLITTIGFLKIQYSGWEIAVQLWQAKEIFVAWLISSGFMGTAAGFFEYQRLVKMERSYDVDAEYF